MEVKFGQFAEQKVAKALDLTESQVPLLEPWAGPDLLSCQESTIRFIHP